MYSLVLGEPMYSSFSLIFAFLCSSICRRSSSAYFFFLFSDPVLSFSAHDLCYNTIIKTINLLNEINSIYYKLTKLVVSKLAYHVHSYLANRSNHLKFIPLLTIFDCEITVTLGALSVITFLRSHKFKFISEK